MQSIKLISNAGFVRKDNSDHGENATADFDATFAHIADKRAMGLLKQFWPPFVLSAGLDYQEALC